MPQRLQMMRQGGVGNANVSLNFAHIGTFYAFGDEKEENLQAHWMSQCFKRIGELR